MPKAITPLRMRQIDEEAIRRYAIPGLLLMENAGRSVSEAVCRYAAAHKRTGRARTVYIFCGKGNNGGDGMVCARHLFNKGLNVKVILLCRRSAVKREAAINLNIIEKMGLDIAELSSPGELGRLKRELKGAIIIDAIFGIGFKGRTKGAPRKAVECINSSRAYRFSIDTPSGLDAESGIAGGVCVKADQTLTMAFPKAGFYKNDGPSYSGRIRVIDIGLPRQLRG